MVKTKVLTKVENFDQYGIFDNFIIGGHL